MKMLPVLFALLLVVGCVCYPVYERPGYYIPADQIPVGKVCDASGWFCQPVYYPYVPYVSQPLYQPFYYWHWYR
jgi:hypothetical protein